MSVLSYISQFTRPSDTITDKQAEILIEAPGVSFSPEMKEKLKFYIKKNWSTRSGKKSAFDLFKEARHPCTHEFFDKLINGAKDEAGGSAPSFAEIMEEKTRNLSELDPSNKIDKQTIDDIKNSFEIQYSEFSKFFTEGYSLHLKDNLLFRNGKPVAVREGDERKRMSQCHEKLTEDDFEQSSIRIGPDEESKGVTGKAFEGYGRRTRRRRHKGKKTKARKIRRRGSRL